MIFLKNKPETISSIKNIDDRGSLAVYSELKNIRIIKITESFKNALRGFHYQKEPNEQNKYIFVLEGRIQDVLIRVENDKLTNEVLEFDISCDDEKNGIFIPKNWAHAYLTLSDVSKVMYLCDSDYGNEISFNPILNFYNWQSSVEKLIISKKDLSC